MVAWNLKFHRWFNSCLQIKKLHIMFYSEKQKWWSSQFSRFNPRILADCVYHSSPYTFILKEDRCDPSEVRSEIYARLDLNFKKFASKKKKKSKLQGSIKNPEAVDAKKNGKEIKLMCTVYVQGNVCFNRYLQTSYYWHSIYMSTHFNYQTAKLCFPHFYG